MTAIAVRNRTFTVGGGLLAAAGLVATLAVGPAAFADTAPTTANATVSSTITLTGDAAFTLTGAPGDVTTSTSGLTAESNNTAGYNVTVLANQANLLPADTVANTHTIPVTSLKVADSASTLTALSTTTPVTVHTQSTASAAGGDALTASYELAMPFVNADTYSGGLTFTAAAN